MIRPGTLGCPVGFGHAVSHDGFRLSDNPPDRLSTV